MRIDYNLLIKSDQICECIPVVSTVSGLVNLFCRCVWLPKHQYKPIQESDESTKMRYCAQVQQKSWVRIILLLIPFVGNFLVKMGDAIENADKAKDRLLEEKREKRAKMAPADRYIDDLYSRLLTYQQLRMGIRHLPRNTLWLDILEKEQQTMREIIDISSNKEKYNRAFNKVHNFKAV